MTVFQRFVEMPLTKREDSYAPASFAEKVLPVQPTSARGRRALNEGTHMALGTLWGSAYGVAASRGLRGQKAVHLVFGVVYTGDVLLNTALGLYRPGEWERARAEAACVQGLLEVGSGARVLDLACGQGRHTSPLRSAGLQVIGLDLSAVLLRAAADSDPDAVLLRADMRALPLADACMDGVVNLFNAFGYFSSDEQDVGVLREVVRVLRPGCVFVQEVHHRDALVRGWEPRTVHPTYEDGLVVTEERRWDGVAGRHAVTYLLRQGPEGVVRRLDHELRVYSLTELVALHERAGLEVLSVRGGLETSSPSPDTPLCVVVSRRPPGRQALPGVAP